MNIKIFTPFSLNKNLVEEYNWCMSKLDNDEDFALLCDHDTSFTSYSWFKQLHDIVKKYPECGCFVASVNRCGGTRQLISPDYNAYISTDDIRTHWEIGKKLQTDHYDDIEDFTMPTPHHFSATCMLVRKSTWNKVGGFKSWTKGNNILGIDSKFHQDLWEAKEKVYIMKGFYIYHVYRFGTGSKTHLVE